MWLENLIKDLYNWFVITRKNILSGPKYINITSLVSPSSVLWEVFKKCLIDYSYLEFLNRPYRLMSLIFSTKDRILTDRSNGRLEFRQKLSFRTGKAGRGHGRMSSFTNLDCLPSLISAIYDLVQPLNGLISVKCLVKEISINQW